MEFPEHVASESAVMSDSAEAKFIIDSLKISNKVCLIHPEQLAFRSYIVCPCQNICIDGFNRFRTAVGSVILVCFNSPEVKGRYHIVIVIQIINYLIDVHSFVRQIFR